MLSGIPAFLLAIVLVLLDRVEWAIIEKTQVLIVIESAECSRLMGLV